MDVVAEFFARFNAKDIEGLFELIAPDATYGEPLTGGVVARDEWRDGAVTTLDLFPDRAIAILRRRSGIDGEAVDAEWSGTPAGSDRKAHYEGVWVFDVADDRITRVRAYY